jgi:hypothetical protein
MTTKFFRKNTFPSPWGRVREGLAFLFLLLWPFVLSAQNGVTVTNLAMSAGTVTFEVSWDKNDPTVPAIWSDTVWVFVDYNDAGKMKRLPLLPGATLTATSAPGVGKVMEEPGNDKGVWVVGNARNAGSFSATVQLLTATAGTGGSESRPLHGACAYASNYPPVGEYTDVTHISFTGTPKYDIVLEEISSGNTYTVYSDGVFPIPEGSAFVSFTDATGAPGTFHCVPPAAPVVAKGEFCYEQSGELVAVVSGGATVVWYDAPTAGNLLYTGDVLSLQPLYNAAAQYYVQAVDGKCRSVRVKAEYTVNNCEISGDCPGYTAGNVGSNTTPAACAVHYAGQIGSAAISSSCMAHDAGRIGKNN